MIGSLLLSLLLVAMLAYGVFQSRTSRQVGGAVSIVAVAALALVWEPDLAAGLAEALGLATGTDLVVYAWIALVVLVLLSLHLKIRAQTQLVTALTRQFAMTTARTRRVRNGHDRPARGDGRNGGSGSNGRGTG